MLAWHVSLAPAAEPVIGMANADGSFSIDNARVFRHATLFDGNIVETTPGGSQIAVKNIDTSGAGAGTLFGLAITLDHKGVYYVDDGDNTLDLLH